MQRLWNVRIGVLCCLLAASCTSNQQTAEIPQTTDSPSIKPTSNQPEKLSKKVRFETTKGDFVVEIHPEWAPEGARRFQTLVENNFYDQARFFRVVPNFMVQFGIAGDPDIQKLWRERTIPDDPVRQSNTRGTITFATSGPNSRTTQLFINFKNNSSSLDPQGFSPFGKVVEGMDVVDSINAEYREQPNQGQIQMRGNEYLNENFPNLDYIKSVTIIE